MSNFIPKHACATCAEFVGMSHNLGTCLTRATLIVQDMERDDPCGDMSTTVVRRDYTCSFYKARRPAPVKVVDREDKLSLTLAQYRDAGRKFTGAMGNLCVVDVPDDLFMAYVAVRNLQRKNAK